MSRHLARAYWFVHHGLLKAALAVAAAVLLVALSSAPAAASLPAIGAGASAAPPVTLTLSVAPQSTKPDNLVLTSHLEGGSRVGGESVAFFVVTTEFGRDQNVPIGSAKTAADGTARITYTPTWSGEQRFIATLTGSPAANAPTATAHYLVPGYAVGPLYAAANPPRPFSFLGHPFLGALLAIVVLVWLTLIVTLLVVVRRLPRLAQGSS